MVSEDQINRVKTEVLRRYEAEANKPLVCAVMGQTGVGKSSLINALFGTNLKTDPVKPCTKEIEEIVVTKSEQVELRFRDLPGLGEAGDIDKSYLESYREQLLSADIVLWVLHCDSRSVSFDIRSLEQILPQEVALRSHLLSKLTLVLNKADTLFPPPWILLERDTIGIFGPHPEIKSLLDQKAKYFRECILRPFATSLTTETYNDGSFDVQESTIESNEFAIYYKGFMDEETRNRFVAKYPRHAHVFDRLLNNHEVIPCSAKFKFNLSKLLFVIVQKMGPAAVSRLNRFIDDQARNALLINDAKALQNFVQVR